MSSGTIATLVVLALVVVFGLIILYDRKRIKVEEGTSKATASTGKSPKEMWDEHVEKLSSRES
jgi:hypothetical protein